MYSVLIDAGVVVARYPGAKADLAIEPEIAVRLIECAAPVDIGWLWDGTATSSPRPPDPSDFGAAIQAHVDATAAARGYGNGGLLASYKDSTVPAWAAEAATFIAWRDAVWLAAYAIMGAVQAGQRQPPTKAGLLAELPGIVWPGA